MELGPRYIAVEGPFGVGKTALARLLSTRLKARLVLEGGCEGDRPNPFLASFYSDRRKYAFQAQLFFLLTRFQERDRLHQEDLFARGGVVTDFTFARDRIFAQLNLSRDELALYEKVYALLGAQMPRPELVVYLQAKPEVLAERLKRRGHDHGGRVPRSYIEEVARAYADFFFQYGDSPLLVVNTSEIDFVESLRDQDDLVAVIQRTRAGVSHYSPLGSRA